MIPVYFEMLHNLLSDFLLLQLQELTDVPEVRECIGVLEKLKPIKKTDVTPDSLICEFIGNGQFKY